MKELLVLFCNIALIDRRFLDLAIPQSSSHFLFTFYKVPLEEYGGSSAVAKWAPDNEVVIADLIPNICAFLYVAPLSVK
jgi:hypothetical protein